MNKNFFLIILLFILCSCEGVKNALSGKKYENSDEFLVIKKNPLVLPPNFNDLPTPRDVSDNTQIEIMIFIHVWRLLKIFIRVSTHLINWINVTRDL